jgi:hypothetical protein
LESAVRERDGLSIMSWSRAFHVPIALPDGRMLRTLRDAGIIFRHRRERSTNGHGARFFLSIFGPWRPAPKDSSQLRLPEAGLGRAQVTLVQGVNGVIHLAGQLRQHLARVRVDLMRTHDQLIDHMAAARVRAAIIAGSAKSHSFAAGLVLKAPTGSVGWAVQIPCEPDFRGLVYRSRRHRVGAPESQGTSSS